MSNYLIICERIHTVKTESVCAHKGPDYQTGWKLFNISKMNLSTIKGNLKVSRAFYDKKIDNLYNFDLVQ